MNSRVQFNGNYDAHECKIEIKNITSDDNGTWTCEMESYVFGEGSGGKVEKNIELIVKESWIKSDAFCYQVFLKSGLEI